MLFMFTICFKINVMLMKIPTLYQEPLDGPIRIVSTHFDAFSMLILTMVTFKSVTLLGNHRCYLPSVDAGND